MTGSVPKLMLCDVAKTFRSRRGPVEALASTSLTVNEGEFVVIVGPSGCGKSTLLRAIAGLSQPTSGRIELDGRPVRRPGRDRGMVFQTYSLFPWLSVRANIEYGLRLRGSPKADRLRVADAYLDLIGLREFAEAYPASLSGGMRQRVAIARALANDPEILLMDEPFGALDSQTRTLMQETLLDLWSRSRKTIVFVTHDIDEAIFLADRVLIMTARPGRFKEEIRIEIPRPRPYVIRSHAQFLAYKDQATQLIREEAVRAAQPERNLMPTADV